MTTAAEDASNASASNRQGTSRRTHRGKRGRANRKHRRGGQRRKRLMCERWALKYIRIMYFNCSSINQRRPIIDKLVYSADIIALQETCLGDNTLKMAGFNVFYNRRHRGQVLLVRECLRVTEVDVSAWDGEEVQLQAIRVQHEHESLTVVNVYACNNKVDEQGWTFLDDISDMEKRVIFCGDFNAKGTTWGNVHSNPQGDKLEEALVTANLICINDGRVTRLARRAGDEDSAIDLALVTPNVVPLCRWEVLGFHDSDHYPCVALLRRGNRRWSATKRNTFVYSNRGSDIVSKIRRDIKRTPGAKQKQRSQPPWWDKDIEAAWRVKRLAVQRWQRERRTNAAPEYVQELKQVVQETTVQFKAVAKRAKNEEWEKICIQVSREKSLGLFWRLYHSMVGTVQKTCLPDFQCGEQIWYRRDADKGEALLARYIEQTDQKDVKRRTTAKDSITNYTMEESGNDCFITVDDIKAALNRSKDTAPGPDGIRYQDINRLSDTDIAALCEEYNGSIKYGIVREEWLHTYLVPVPKPGKDPTKINNFRIISVQNTIGKLLEKILARKMAIELEASHTFPNTLGGYRMSRETWCNAAVFAYDVYEGFHARQETCAIAIDLEDAYNRVPFEVMLQQLKDVNIHPLWIRWIASALFKKTVALKCGSWMSQPRVIHPGLPQGSPLSPILFNVHTIGITANANAGLGRTLSYADDILVYRQGRDRTQIAEEVQEELNRISGWCNVSGAHVNPTKASVTWFSLDNNTINAPTPDVTVCGESVPRASILKYLGVSFDRSLNFKAHIDTVIAKTRKGLAAIKLMAAAKCPQKSLVMLYNGLVLSVVDYALAILTLSQTQSDRLERVQNEAMRIILGCTRDTPCQAMRYLLNLPNMDSRVKVNRARAYVKVSQQPTHPLHGELTRSKGNRLKRGRSWMGRAEDVIGRVCPLDTMQHGQEWVLLTPDLASKVNVIITLDKGWRDKNPFETNAEVYAIIDDNTDDNGAVIFTDGSVTRNQRSSWAFTASFQGKTIKEDSGAFSSTTSSFTMETMAVTKAFAWLQTQNFSSISILSDSMSMLMKIDHGYIRRQWRDLIQRGFVKKVTFIFVPGHAGVRGNERADFLAGKANVTEGVYMDHSDIITALSTVFQDDDFDGDHESSSLKRIREMGIKRGIARHEQHLGGERRVFNQHRMGVVSLHTLREILRRRSEQLWICPDCVDDNPNRQ